MNLFKIIVVLLFMTAPSFGLQAQKIGYTNVELILAYMPEAQKVQKEIETFSKTLESKIKVKEDYYKAKLNDFYAKNETAKMDQAEQDKWVKELTQLEKEIQEAVGVAENQLMAKQQELMQPVLERLQKAIDDIAVAGAYTYVLNQTTGMNIIYGAENLDITEQIAGKLGVNIPKE